MKVLIDVNLSPEWVAVLRRNGWEALHWSTVGDPHAPDHIIMDWARTNNYVVFTHDLDFGAILAVTQGEGPSVFQVRTQDVAPEHLEEIVIRALHQHKLLLEQGALVVVDESKVRARILPLTR
jgi:predicted nuclease of predicted toxin-antitoxin system